MIPISDRLILLNEEVEALEHRIEEESKRLLEVKRMLQKKREERATVEWTINQKGIAA